MTRTASRASRIPPLAPHPPIPLPPHLDTRLSNGLRVVAVNAATTHLAEIRLFLPLPAHTTDASVAAVLTALVTTRTAHRTACEIETALTHDGSVLGAAWSGDHLVLSASVPADRLRDILGLLAEFLGSPHYTSQACTVVADRLADRARRTRFPSAQEALRSHCFPTSPHAQPPSPESLAAVTADRVASLHRATVRPQESFLVVVGAVAPHLALATSAAAFGSWENDSAHSEEPPPRWSGHGVQVLGRSGAAQAQFALAAPAPPRTDPTFAALSIGNCLFGGYFSSRLMHRLREHDGLVYQVESSIEEILHNPAVVISCATAPNKAEKTLAELKNQIRGLRQQPPTKQEIDAAREYMTGITYIGQTSQAGLASTLAGVLASGLDPTWLHDFPDQLGTVTPDQVSDVFERYYTVEAFSGVIATAADSPERHTV